MSESFISRTVCVIAGFLEVNCNAGRRHFFAQFFQPLEHKSIRRFQLSIHEHKHHWDQSFRQKQYRGNNDETSKFNFYETLGIDKNASDQQIKDAYKRSALKYHPDRNLGNEEALENFKKISIA
uniref:J domain-containing protein n=1 Tax=Ditylenchus dipsaci TaxID=166011 RepID=A0A915EME9_9BILA